MGLRVRFLGSGDAFGSGGRLQACMLVEADGTSFMLDCGPAALVGMRRDGLDPNTVGLIVLSHLHGDHFGGVPFMVLDGQLVSRRTEPLTVAGPPGTKRRLQEAMELMFPGSADAPRRFAFEVVELEVGRPNRLLGLTITPHEVAHPCGAPPLALRIECGDQVLAYSGDTEWTDTLVAVAREADVFVAEAYYFDRRVKFHLDYATLRANAERLGARRTIVTHMSADMLARLDELHCEYAEDGKVFEIAPRAG